MIMKIKLFMKEVGELTSFYQKRILMITQDPNECWVRWGWIEDNIINKYLQCIKDSDIHFIF